MSRIGFIIQILPNEYLWMRKINSTNLCQSNQNSGHCSVWEESTIGIETEAYITIQKISKISFNWLNSSDPKDKCSNILLAYKEKLEVDAVFW